MFSSLLNEILAYNPRADVGLLFQIRRDLAVFPINREHPYSILALGIQVAHQLTGLLVDLSVIGPALVIAAAEEQLLGIEFIATNYGLPIAELVKNTLHLSSYEYKVFNERHAHNYRRLLITLAPDFRSLLLLVAWKITRFKQQALSMNPIDSPDSRLEYIRDVLIPLCEEISVGSFKRELENLQLYWTDPVLYNGLANEIAKRTAGAESFVKSFSSRLVEMLGDLGITAEVSGRTKGVASTWFKIHHRVGSLEEVFDLVALRIIVENREHCYDVIAAIHATWNWIPEKYKDYIERPKKNGYQSIHTTIRGPEGRIIEIQVRTFEMHDQAERGVAIHSHYKKLISRGHLTPGSMNAARKEEASASIFIVTPQSEILDLPEGATGLDAAFRIHSEIGYRAVGLKIGNQLTSLRKTLSTGDRIEIVTSSKPRVTEDWINFVKSRRARAKIERWLAEAADRRGIEDGLRWLAKQVKKLGTTLPQVEKSGHLNEVLKGLGLRDLNNLGSATYRNLKIGERFIAKLGNALQRSKLKEQPVDTSSMGNESLRESRSPGEKPETFIIVVEGKPDRQPRLSKCCNPTPNSAIFAFITRGRGFTIHSTSCPNAPMLLLQKERIREAQWRRIESKVK